VKTLWKTLLPYLLVIAAVIAVAKASGVIRWLFTTDGVDPVQAHTIDSLRNVNRELDSSLTISLRQQDSTRQAGRRQRHRDSITSARRLDSLEALIPDTATMIPRPVYEAIVAEKDRMILTLGRALFVSDSLLDERTLDLGTLRTQNAGLLTQVNSLEKKANPGLIRRAKIALPFVIATWGSCKAGLLDC